MLWTLTLIQQHSTDFTQYSCTVADIQNPSLTVLYLPSLQLKLRTCRTSSGHNYDGSNDNYEDGAAVCFPNTVHSVHHTVVWLLSFTYQIMLFFSFFAIFKQWREQWHDRISTINHIPAGFYQSLLGDVKYLLGCSNLQNNMKWKGKCIRAHHCHQSAKQLYTSLNRNILRKCYLDWISFTWGGGVMELQSQKGF